VLFRATTRRLPCFVLKVADERIWTALVVRSTSCHLRLHNSPLRRPVSTAKTTMPRSHPWAIAASSFSKVGAEWLIAPLYPFTPSNAGICYCTESVIRFDIPETSEVFLMVVNMLGEEVAGRRFCPDAQACSIANAGCDRSRFQASAPRLPLRSAKSLPFLRLFPKCPARCTKILLSRD